MQSKNGVKIILKINMEMEMSYAIKERYGKSAVRNGMLCHTACDYIEHTNHNALCMHFRNESGRPPVLKRNRGGGNHRCGECIEEYGFWE